MTETNPMTGWLCSCLLLICGTAPEPGNGPAVDSAGLEVASPPRTIRSQGRARNTFLVPAYDDDDGDDDLDEDKRLRIEATAPPVFAAVPTPTPGLPGEAPGGPPRPLSTRQLLS